RARDCGADLPKGAAKDPDDPFDGAIVTELDVAEDPRGLEGALASQSLMGGRRLVRLRMASEKPAVDKAIAEAVERHAAGELNPDAFFLIEAGNLGRDSATRKAAEEAAGAAPIPRYEDEPGDVRGPVRETLARD